MTISSTKRSRRGSFDDTLTGGARVSARALFVRGLTPALWCEIHQSPGLNRPNPRLDPRPPVRNQPELRPFLPETAV